MGNITVEDLVSYAEPFADNPPALVHIARRVRRDMQRGNIRQFTIHLGAALWMGVGVGDPAQSLGLYLRIHPLNWHRPQIEREDYDVQQSAFARDFTLWCGPFSLEGSWRG